MTEIKKEVIDILHNIQKSLKVAKNQKNDFGKYNYRSLEDIFEGLKPILDKNISVTVSDEIVLIGDRYYVKAIGTLHTQYGSISNTAFAREPVFRKGMDEAQITGATSSYARKYALSGLFCLDDNKDPDTQENTEPVKQVQKPKPVVSTPAKIAGNKLDFEGYIKALSEIKTNEDYQQFLNEHGSFVNALFDRVSKGLATEKQQELVTIINHIKTEVENA